MTNPLAPGAKILDKNCWNNSQPSNPLLKAIHNSIIRSPYLFFLPRQIVIWEYYQFITTDFSCCFLLPHTHKHTQPMLPSPMTGLLIKFKKYKHAIISTITTNLYDYLWLLWLLTNILTIYEAPQNDNCSFFQLLKVAIHKFTRLAAL